MSSSSSLQGLCPAPFMQASLFPTTGGFIDGRLCEPVAALGNLTCCLPCPQTDWVYTDEFMDNTLIANWLNVGGMIAILFMLLSVAVLDKKWTHGHYLASCLLVAVGCIQVAFIAPLIVEPDQCHNEITPNDMGSSNECAVTGSFLLFGAWATVLWVFYRALSLHLQICWALVPGKKFFIIGMVLGWGLPAVGLVIALMLTGVSYRFGNVCHINHSNSLADFWGPLIGIGAAGMVIQVITMGYCIHVYVRSLFDDSQQSTQTSSQLPSYSGSVRTATARQAYNRVRKIVMLQWRGIATVICVLVNILFFAVVFVQTDNNRVRAGSSDSVAAQKWLLCLVKEKGNKTPCLPLVKGIVTPEAEVLAVLVMLSVIGFWCLIFNGRWGMVLGWVDMFKRRTAKKNEFVSVDANSRGRGDDPRDYEMLTSDPNKVIVKTPEPVASPASYYTRDFSPSPKENSDYFGRDAKYRSPPLSFSSPRPPSAQQQNQPFWDPAATHASPTRRPHGPEGYSKPYS